jgi:hypothetical protein
VKRRERVQEIYGTGGLISAISAGSAGTGTVLIIAGLVPDGFEPPSWKATTIRAVSV